MQPGTRRRSGRGNRHPHPHPHCHYHCCESQDLAERYITVTLPLHYRYITVTLPLHYQDLAERALDHATVVVDLLRGSE